MTDAYTLPPLGGIRRRYIVQEVASYLPGRFQAAQEPRRSHSVRGMPPCCMVSLLILDLAYRTIAKV